MQHAGNIVIHQGTAKITDFGHSKSMNTETDLHGSFFGNIPYVAPEIIKAAGSKTKQEQVSKADDEAKKDPYTKSSDVYSLGVVLWQISSGKMPFEGQDKHMLYATIMSGSRENRMLDTPDKYYNLYEECWDDELEKRPIIERVYDVLENLLKKEGEKMDIDSVNKSK